MQLNSFPTATVVACLLCVSETFGLVLLHTDFREDHWVEIGRVAVLLSFPSLLLAAMGSRKTSSRTLSQILFCCATTSLTVWFIVLGYSAKSRHADGPTGLDQLLAGNLVASVRYLHLGLLAVAALSYVVFRNSRDKECFRVHVPRGLRMIIAVPVSLTTCGAGFLIVNLILLKAGVHPSAGGLLVSCVVGIVSAIGAAIAVVRGTDND